MDFQIIWTDPALADLREIVTYMSRDDSAAAERVGHDSVDHVEILHTFPFIGPTYHAAQAVSAGRSYVVTTASFIE